jgi:uncharacterized protein
MSKASPAARIDAALSNLPVLNCTPGCHRCCGPVSMTTVEWTRIVERLGYEPRRDPETLACPLLGPDGCTVYDIRPAVCRLFGVCADLRCPEAKPERVISKPERVALLRHIERLGGGWVFKLSRAGRS